MAVAATAVRLAAVVVVERVSLCGSRPILHVTHTLARTSSSYFRPYL